VVNLGDPTVEDALNDSRAMEAFAKIDLGRQPVPDETTICKFRHLLERNSLGPVLLEEVNAYLAENGLKIGRGTIVDATIIAAPSSTKNASGKRDPEMHQTMKGNEWHFGMKAHIGMDSKLKIVHSFAATPANAHDSHLLPELLHGDETRVWGDAAYRGQTAAIRSRAPAAADFTHHHSARKKGLSKRQQTVHRTKARVRAKVEHAFYVIKRIFGFVKVRYRGIAKNAHRLVVNFALANLYLHRRRLLSRA
jgi:IS5 family transposase